MRYNNFTNQHLPRQQRTTQAAEGTPRWSWTVDDLDRFVKHGIIDEDDDVELLGGELVPMSPLGIDHETISVDIADWLIERLPKGLRVKTELKWRPSQDTYCEPDIAVFPRSIRPVAKAPPSAMLLIVEIADSSLRKDMTTKAALYARLGVREYWVVDTAARMTMVFRDPSPGDYRHKRRIVADKPLMPSLLQGIVLRLSELPFANE